MKKNEKLNCTFKVSLVAMTLGSLLNSPMSYADINSICSNSSGCYYSNGIYKRNDLEGTRWSLSTNYIDYFVNNNFTSGDNISHIGEVNEKNIKIAVVPKHYQNTPATESGFVKNEYGNEEYKYNILFGVSNAHNELRSNAKATIPTGTTMTLSEAQSGSRLVHLHNAEIDIEKGVKLTLDPSFAQKHNLPEEEHSESIINVHNSTVNTQADLILNSRNGTGIDASGNSIITSSNHTISMLGDFSTAYSTNESTKLNINNVTITGSGKHQTVFELDGEGSLETLTAIINNSKINLSNTGTLVGFVDEGNPQINFDNSTIQIGTAISIFTDSEEDTIGTVNLKNTKLFTSKALVSINDQELFNERQNYPNLFDNDDDDSLLNGNYQLTINASDNSQLSGAILNNLKYQTTGAINANLNDSQWNFNKSSQLNNLALSNSDVTFDPTSEFKTLTIKGDLSGSGNFTLNTDLASQQGDKIVVNGTDSGAFGLRVQDSGKTPNAANGSVTLVETQTGTAQFILLGRDYVDAGAYRYRLQKSGNNWVLSNRSGENSTTNNSNNDSGNNLVNNNTNQTASNNGSQTNGNSGTNANNANNGAGTNTGSATDQVELSGQSNALVSLRQAQLLLVEDNLAGLHQRLGELKKSEQGNVWVRNSNHRNKLGSLSVAENAKTSGFKQRVNSTQVGADFAATESIRVGGFVGNARSNVNFEGEYGSGKVRSQTVGLYGTYLADNGFYLDNVVKYERVKSESNRTGERKYNGYTLSSEIGRIHTLGSWTITPQLQAAWTKLSGQDDEERLTALTARAGVRVANHLNLGEWQLQPYAEVNGITTKTNSNAVQVDGCRFDVAESRGRIQTALGVNAALGQHRVGLEGSVTNGKHLDQPYQIQAVYRYSW